MTCQGYLDLDFFDTFSKQGASVPSHARHMADWHEDEGPTG